MSLLNIAVSVLALLGAANALTKSPGCGRALGTNIRRGGTGQSNSLSITSNGVTRTFLLHIPTNYDVNDARGLVFSFHGRSRTAVSQEALSSFSDPYFNPDLLAVYPQGLGSTPQWQGDPEATTDDVLFTLDLLTYINNNYCVNTEAVYSTGKSNGAGFSLNVLACDPVAVTKFAAFAGAASADYQASMTEANCNPLTVPITCNPGKTRIPILELHGTADDTIPYNGGGRRTQCLPSIPYFMQSWSARNGLGTTNQSTVLIGGNVRREEFGLSQGVLGQTTHYWIKNMGHSWPATIGNSDSATPTFINATSLMYDFFKRYTLPQTSAAWCCAV
ncbi:related to poly(3-hydroxybutyrate) depolymerase [Ramularia collo-cygni]|uniref:feruloyl esterase n=1 Tax=Ramularia collo-cygni TaxID=112498 RepID=A0A2D3V2P4_9PEZI|nr:related to poly(3-hydroxybutyrate) depolymerase [Ramularia collo-cygni]CZT14543.1 related to poly(3-hydroxybutyrate) depolymerase [Ramularia collo-cygni]